MEKERNTLLDFVKAVSALGVILVHFRFPGYFGAVMCSVGVVGVIIFFFIAGYSSYHNLIGLLIRQLMGAMKVPQTVVNWTLPILVMISAVLVSYVIMSASKAAWQNKA